MIIGYGVGVVFDTFGGGGGGVAPEPDPIISEFGNGNGGAYYDPSDLDTLFTTHDGTTNATVGDPVGRIEDKFGNGNHAIQTVDEDRPILRQKVDGRHYLETNGSQYLVLPDDLVSGSASFSMCVGFAVDNIAAGQFVCGLVAPSTKFFYTPYIDASQIRTRVANGGLDDILGTGVVSATPYTTTIEVNDLDNKVLRVDGVKIGENTIGGGGPKDMPVQSLYLGARNNNGTADLFMTGEIYGFVLVRDDLLVADLEILETHIDAKTKAP